MSLYFRKHFLSRSEPSVHSMQGSATEMPNNIAEEIIKTRK